MIVLLIYVAMGSIVATSLSFDNKETVKLPKWERARLVFIIIFSWPFVVLAILVNAVMEEE